jgi:hypothetical protein
MEFSSTPIWLQIHDMPMDCMNRTVGTKIGMSLGEVTEVAILDDDVGWGHFHWVRVVIDLYQPLDRGHSLLLEGNSCLVSFRYKKLPTFCYRCGCILHGNEGCLEKRLTKRSHFEAPPEWGSWLRAEDPLRGLEVSENSHEGRLKNGHDHQNWRLNGDTDQRFWQSAVARTRKESMRILSALTLKSRTQIQCHD